MRRVVLLILGLPLLAACDSSGSAVEVMQTSISGTWVGEVTSSGVAMPVSIELTEAATFVTGSGSVTVRGDARGFSVSDPGSYLHPLLSLSLIFDNPPPGTLAGNVSEDRMVIRATMTGPGFSGIADLELRRE